MIKRLATFLSCFGAAWTLTAAVDPRLETLQKADDERVAAIIAADPARLTASFSDDLRYAHSTGAVDGKASYIDLLVSGRTKYVVYHYEERAFTFPAPGIALMTGRVHIKATSATGVSDGVLSILAVWREEQGRWRFLAWQSCKLPASKPLLPPAWNAKQAADNVLASLINTTAPQVKGAHDAEFVCVGDRAFIVTEANEVRPSENAEWPFIYAALSVVNLKTMALEKIIPLARGGQKFENETLPPGACFVPRILQKDARTVRCYFASEEPSKRQSQTWFIDFDIERMAFENRIHKVKLKTAAGTFDMQPQFFHADAAAVGFTRKPVDHGLYIFDSFKEFAGRTHVALNNFSGGQNALAVVNRELDAFEVIGHYNEPQTLRLTESAVNRLPDGTWMAVCRQDGGNGNYTFTTSKDGRTWTRGEHRDFVPNGGSSKPTFDRFGDTYYLGWQERTKINGVNRSVFNLDISRDGNIWERKYRFESEKSFQYPAFHKHNGTIWLTVTQGDTDESRKERIMFGKLEDAGQFAEQAVLKRKPMAPTPEKRR